MLLQTLNSGMDTRQLQKYLDRMKLDRNWGDGIVLSAAVMLYNRPIVVVSPDGAKEHIHVHVMHVDAANPSNAEPIRLGYVFNNHYVSIHSNDPRSSSDIFSQSMQILPATLRTRLVHLKLNTSICPMQQQQMLKPQRQIT